ncbi:hypothetical protein D3C73_830890 [compost metagenome]
MSRKFVEREGHRWVEKGIVTSEQLHQILQLYADKKHAIGLVPILGSVLVGLGILSFVAANWQEIPQLMRLLVILISLTGFYMAGESFQRKGHDKLGIALIGIGLISFGAGIILIAQMFHLEAYNINTWIAWSVVGVILTYLYRSRYLFFISFLIATIIQWYSVEEFGQFSLIACAVTLIGLGYYTWKRQDPFLTWVICISFIIQSIMLIAVYDWTFIWVFVPILMLYTLGDWIRNRQLAAPLQAAPLIAVFLFDLFIVLFAGERGWLNDYKDWLAEPITYLTTMAVLFGISLALKLRSNRGITAMEWIIMPPLLYTTMHVDAVYVVVLFLFSLFVLWRGYVEEWRFKINLGTLLFLCSTMVAYGKLTWNFMDKSLFFIMGGVLLLLISWLLNRQKKQFFKDEKGED